MSLRVVIVDDEPLARQGLRARLEREPDVEVVGECGSGRAAIRTIRDLEPDLVFLDVQMPGVDGFGVVEALGPERVPVVVFVTAHDDYTLRAFDVHALDYLLKPVDDERLRLAVDRARVHVDERRAGEIGRRLAALVASMRDGDSRAAERPLERFVVKTGGRIFFVTADEVDWIEAVGDYVRLHVGAKGHLVRDTMAAVEARLDPRRFVRIHRSTIVNAARIRELRALFNGEYVAVLGDGTELKASRGYRARLREFFGTEL